MSNREYLNLLANPSTPVPTRLRSGSTQPLNSTTTGTAGNAPNVSISTIARPTNISTSSYRETEDIYLESPLELGAGMNLPTISGRTKVYNLLNDALNNHNLTYDTCLQIPVSPKLHWQYFC